jgi:hypothetical protein
VQGYKGKDEESGIVEQWKSETVEEWNGKTASGAKYKVKGSSWESGSFGAKTRWLRSFASLRMTRAFVSASWMEFAGGSEEPHS